MHLNSNLNCITCDKKLKREDGLRKHALKDKLNADVPHKMTHFSQSNQPNRVEEGLDVVRGALTLGESEEVSDNPELSLMTAYCLLQQTDT